MDSFFIGHTIELFVCLSISREFIFIVWREI